MTTLKELKALDAKAIGHIWKYEEKYSMITVVYMGLEHCVADVIPYMDYKSTGKLIATTLNALPDLIRVVELAEEALQDADDAVFADIVSEVMPQRQPLRNLIQEALSEIRKLKGE